jgi:Cys-tRNA(Pro)/Cys-tRNA(Cys) deacylase
MSKTTRATLALEKAGVAFSVHSYDYDPAAENIGLQAAAALGVPGALVLKTLMVLIDGKHACVIAPSDRDVSMKRLATALGGKSAQMMKAPDAERVTGYKVGGISPFGQMKRVPVALEALALENDLVFINGGGRGLQLRLSPRDAAAVLQATIASLIA